MNLLPDKVYNSDEIKIFNVKADIMYCDDWSGREEDYTDCNVIFNNPVPILNDNYKVIGSAVLDFNGHILSADIFLDYATPERLNIETKSVPLFPHIDYLANIEVSDKPKVTDYEVTSIMLSMYPPEDTRIFSL